MRLCFRDPRLNANPGWYLRVWGKWYRVVDTTRKWGLL